jgi:hypothetical protein
VKKEVGGVIIEKLNKITVGGGGLFIYFAYQSSSQ